MIDLSSTLREDGTEYAPGPGILFNSFMEKSGNLDLMLAPFFSKVEGIV
jgi:hypothetical protein